MSDTFYLDLFESLVLAIFVVTLIALRLRLWKNKKDNWTMKDVADRQHEQIVFLRDEVKKLTQTNQILVTKITGTDSPITPPTASAT